MIWIAFLVFIYDIPARKYKTVSLCNIFQNNTNKQQVTNAKHSKEVKVIGSEGLC